MDKEPRYILSWPPAGLQKQCRHCVPKESPQLVFEPRLCGRPSPLLREIPPAWCSCFYLCKYLFMSECKRRGFLFLLAFIFYTCGVKRVEGWSYWTVQIRSGNVVNSVHPILNAFAELRQATVSFVICPSPRPYRTAGLYWTNFHNEIWYLSSFRKSVEKIQIWQE